MTLELMSDFETRATAHARLLYLSFNDSLEAWKSWQSAWVKLDDYIEQSLRFNWANQNLYFYFFSDTSGSPAWVGREVCGHEQLDHSEFSLFDSYRSEVVSSQMPREHFFELNHSKLFNVAQGLRQGQSEQLAKTWRVEFNFSESYRNNDNAASREQKDIISQNLASVAFQFFKSH